MQLLVMNALRVKLLYQEILKEIIAIKIVQMPTLLVQNVFKMFKIQHVFKLPVM